MKFLNLIYSFKEEILLAISFINLNYYLNKKYHIGKLYKTLIVHNSSKFQINFTVTKDIRHKKQGNQ